MGIIVAIDGPAGSGKSTTAKAVARQLGFTYVDTGAMYRAITLKVLRSAVAIEDSTAIVDLARRSEIHFRLLEGDLHIFLDGEDVSQAIRSSAVAQVVSTVSAIAGVRAILVQRQRELAETTDIVMEGRDIGTNVFPNAQFKFYLSADLPTRAQRRIADYERVGQKLTQAEIIEELKKRDKIDSSRQSAPLRKAADAIEIDTSNLKFEDQVSAIVDHVRTGINQSEG